MRVALASLSFGAGAIHLAMATSHAGEWLVEGVVFAIAGWLQLGLALAFAVRPSKAALVIACARESALRRGVGLDSTIGMPFGPSRAMCTTSDSSTSRPLSSKWRSWFWRPGAGHAHRRTRDEPSLTRRLCGDTTVRSRTRHSAIVSPSARGHAHGGDEGAGVEVGRGLIERRPSTRATLGARLAERWPGRPPDSRFATRSSYLVPCVQVPPRGVWGRRPARLDDDGGLARPAAGATPPSTTLMLRYLAAFGPATVATSAWSGLTGLRRGRSSGSGPGCATFRDEGAASCSTCPTRRSRPRHAGAATVPARVRQRRLSPRGPVADHPASPPHPAAARQRGNARHRPARRHVRGRVADRPCR